MKSIFIVLAMMMAVSVNVYGAEWKSLNAIGITFSWKVSDKQLDIKVISPHPSKWVGVGFNPQNQMTGANFILGKISKSGEVTIEDHYGVASTKHKPDIMLKGQDNLTNKSGNRTEKNIEIGFTLPIKSNDDKDGNLTVDQDQILLLAYGMKSSFKEAHENFAVIKVNFTTGKFELIKKRK